MHVTTGLNHACALLDNGDITCWGHNSDGQLGDGTTTDRSSPTAVSTSYSFDTSRVMGSGSGSGSGSSMTNVAGALSCSVSPSLPNGLSINSSTCTISGTPTVETSNTTYTVTANISNVTYQGSVWLSTSPYATITSAVEGAALNLGEAMTPITLNYTVNANASTGPVVRAAAHPLLMRTTKSRPLAILAVSSTTVLCRAGDGDGSDNWVMEEHLMETPPPTSRHS